jgi:hypothetical protein
LARSDSGDSKSTVISGNYSASRADEDDLRRWYRRVRRCVDDATGNGAWLLRASERCDAKKQRRHGTMPSKQISYELVHTASVLARCVTAA